MNAICTRCLTNQTLSLLRKQFEISNSRLVKDLNNISFFSIFQWAPNIEKYPKALEFTTSRPTLSHFSVRSYHNIILHHHCSTTVSSTTQSAPQQQNIATYVGTYIGRVVAKDRRKTGRRIGGRFSAARG